MRDINTFPAKEFVPQVVVVVVDRFYIALFSALEQTHCDLFAYVIVNVVRTGRRVNSVEYPCAQWNCQWTQRHDWQVPASCVDDRPKTYRFKEKYLQVGSK